MRMIKKFICKIIGHKRNPYIDVEPITIKLGYNYKSYSKLYEICDRCSTRISI